MRNEQEGFAAFEEVLENDLAGPLQMIDGVNFRLEDGSIDPKHPRWANNPKYQQMVMNYNRFQAGEYEPGRDMYVDPTEMNMMAEMFGEAINPAKQGNTTVDMYRRDFALVPAGKKRRGDFEFA